VIKYDVIAIEKAQETKPIFGDKCNHCGWCCLTEPCVVGKEITGVTMGQCPLLLRGDHSNPDKYYCSLVIHNAIDKETIGVGTGCDAMTQEEVITSHRC
jgi:hypothetical protein